MKRLTRSQFARLCGVNRSTVTRWLQNGRIVADPAGMIDPEVAQRMRSSDSGLMTKAEFARLCGVTDSTVSKWLQNGRIVADHAGMIDPEAAARMRLATESPEPHHQARKAQFDEVREEAASAAQEPAGDEDEPTGMEALGHQLKRATVDLQRNKAEQAAIEIDKAMGTLVEMSEVQYVLGDLGATLRSLLEGMPDRLAGEIAAHQGNTNAVHKALEDAAREMLTAISEQMSRRVAGLAA